MAAFTDLLKRLKPDQLPKIPPKLIEWTVYTVLFLILGAGGVGVLLWSIYQPQLLKLEEKDPERYLEMKGHFKNLEWEEAWKLYQKLDRMKMSEVFQLRYTKWKSRWDKDINFRDQWLETRAGKHDTNKANRLTRYATQSRNLEDLKRPLQLELRAAWQRAAPWEKGLMLHETCIRYLKQEVEEVHLRRRTPHTPFAGRSFLVGGRVTAYSPSERCDHMIAVDHQPATVEQSLKRLKAGMNYYYFSLLMDELGLSREEMFPLSERVLKMADDFETF